MSRNDPPPQDKRTRRLFAVSVIAVIFMAVLLGLLVFEKKKNLSRELNHHQLKLVGLKEPMCSMCESAEADSPLWGNMEVPVILLEVLGGDILHDDFIGHIA